MNFKQIRIENTNACPCKCLICPREKMTRRVGTMSLEDFSLVLKRLDFSYEQILHLHGYGEPLLDPYLIQKVQMSRRQWPRAEIQFYSTLGVPVEKDFFSKIINAGVSTIYVSCYGWDEKSYRAFHGVDHFSQVLENLRHLCEAKKLCGNLMVLLWFSGKEMMDACLVQEKKRALFLRKLQEMGIDGIAEQELHNFGDGRTYHRDVQRRCFRLLPIEILQITWDLKVIPCCFDYNAQMPLGDMRLQTLKEIFDGRPYEDLLRAHFFSDFQQYPICQKCDKKQI